MNTLKLIQLTRELRAAATEKLGRVPAWRKLDWQLWRDEYLDRTRPNDRLAWVGVSKSQCRLTTLEDIWLGGLQVRTGQPIEAGTLLRVEVVEDGDLATEPLTVRVMTAVRKGRDWLVNCCFAKPEKLELAPALAG